MLHNIQALSGCPLFPCYWPTPLIDFSSYLVIFCTSMSDKIDPQIRIIHKLREINMIVANKKGFRANYTKTLSKMQIFCHYAVSLGQASTSLQKNLVQNRFSPAIIKNQLMSLLNPHYQLCRVRNNIDIWIYCSRLYNSHP